MEEVLAIAVAIWLVSSVYARECNPYEMQQREKVWAKFIKGEPMELDTIIEEIKFMHQCTRMQFRRINTKLSLGNLHELIFETHPEKCSSNFVLDFKDYTEGAERNQNFMEIFNHLYDKHLKQCEVAVVIWIKKFQTEMPHYWTKLGLFYGAIKKNDQLLADLNDNETGITEEMMSALGSMLKNKNSVADEPYTSVAIGFVKDACNELEVFVNRRPLEVVRRLSKNIKPKSELAEYIGYWRLCIKVENKSGPIVARLTEKRARKHHLLEEIKRINVEIARLEEQIK